MPVLGIHSRHSHSGRRRRHLGIIIFIPSRHPHSSTNSTLTVSPITGVRMPHQMQPFANLPSPTRRPCSTAPRKNSRRPKRPVCRPQRRPHPSSAAPHPRFTHTRSLCKSGPAKGARPCRPKRANCLAVVQASDLVITADRFIALNTHRVSHPPMGIVHMSRGPFPRVKQRKIMPMSKRSSRNTSVRPRQVATCLP